MPTIKQYTSEKALQGLNEQPLTQGIEHMTTSARFVVSMADQEKRSYEELGRVGAQIYDKVKEYNDSQTELHFTSGLMDLEMQQAQARNDFFKTPQAQDPAALQQFRDQQKQQIEQFQGQFAGTDPRLQERFNARLGEYQLRTFNNETVQLSEISAANDIAKLDGMDRKGQNMAQAAGRTNDLAGLDAVLASQQDAYDAVAKDPNLSPVVAARLKEHFAEVQSNAVMAFGIGRNQADPTADKAMSIEHNDRDFGPGASKYAGMLDYKQLDALRNNAKGEAAWKQAENNATVAARERATRGWVGDQFSKLTANLYDQNGHPVLPADAWEQFRQIINNPKAFYVDREGNKVPGFTPDEVSAMATRLTRAASGDIKEDNSQAYIRLEEARLNGTLSRDMIMKEAPNLTGPTFDKFVTDLQSAKDPSQKMLDRGFKDAFDAAKANIVTQFNNPQQNLQLTNWAHDAHAVLDNAKKTMSADQIYNTYLNPRDPHYIGSTSVFQRYRGTINGAPPPLPGTLIEQPQPGLFGRLMGEGKVPPKAVTESPMPGLPAAEGREKPAGMSDSGYAAKEFMFGGGR
jgi:hypothetical protein